MFLQEGNEVFFRIKRVTQLKKLMNAYCDRQSVDMNAIAFLFDGRRLHAEQTPDELDMEDGDEIDAMLHQTGGCCGGGVALA
ncbi:small ubiquitin-related modifier 1-like [Raphanus sativus]|uniref:Small ubiquitin-related modifier n=1 Tax=Raphanus sativus TaxID=3726 RepID=A0A9W3CM01_RAPSA|nr:small ubiquitin-related modifier 1-like [Raphanus sativus]